MQNEIVLVNAESAWKEKTSYERNGSECAIYRKKKKERKRKKKKTAQY